MDTCDLCGGQLRSCADVHILICGNCGVEVARSRAAQIMSVEVGGNDMWQVEEDGRVVFGPCPTPDECGEWLDERDGSETGGEVDDLDG